ISYENHPGFTIAWHRTVSVEFIMLRREQLKGPYANGPAVEQGSQNRGQRGATDRYECRHECSGMTGEAHRASQNPAKDCPGDTHGKIHRGTVALAFEALTGHPPCSQSDNNPN